MRLGIIVIHRHPICGATRKISIRDLSRQEHRQALRKLLVSDLVLEMRLEGDSEATLDCLYQLLVEWGVCEQLDHLDAETQENVFLYQHGDRCYRQQHANPGYIFVDPSPQPSKWVNFQVYYEDFNASVNSFAVIAGDRSFSTSKLVAVESVAVSKDFDQKVAKIEIGTGSLMILGGIIALVFGVPRIGMVSFVEILTIMGGSSVFGGGFVAVKGWRDFTTTIDRHIVRVKMTFDEADLISTPDEAYAQQLTQAIEAAILDHAQRLVAMSPLKSDDLILH